jgi:predicted DNA-binding transcriptional regulator AlpA
MRMNSQQGFLRLKQIVGDPKRGIPAIIPVSPSTWWEGVKSGRFPKPVKLSQRCTAWRISDISTLMENIGREGGE